MKWLRRTNLLVASLSLFLFGCGQPESPLIPDAPAAPSVDVLETATRTLIAGDTTNAEQRLRDLLIERPDDPAVVLLAATIDVAKGNHLQAISTASSIDSTSIEFTASRSLIANCAATLNGDVPGFENIAWAAMEKALSEDSKNLEIRRALIKLLNRRGYRHRACQHIEVLCQHGLATEDELRGLIHRRDAYPMVTQCDASSIEDRKSSDGSLAVARRFQTCRHFTEAYELLSREQATGWIHPEHAALFGTVLAEKQAFDEIPAWIEFCHEKADRYSEYWSAIGTWLVANKEYPLAMGALLLAVEIDPSSVIDYKRMTICAIAIGGEFGPREMMERAKLIERMVELSTMIEHGSEFPELRRELCDDWLALGRPLECLQLSSLTPSVPTEVVKVIKQERLKLLANPDYTELLKDFARFGISKEDYPAPGREQLLAISNRLPVSRQQLANSSPSSKDRSRATIRFVDVAANVGVDFDYLNHPRRVEKYFRLHESLGGGISVIDFDRDGNPDLYLGQGSGDPPHQRGEKSNRLYRSFHDRFVDVTDASGTTDFGYTTGIASGDIDQDGFPDLIVGSLGANRVLINQGDGTFNDTPRWLGDAPPLYTASLAIADVTGDHLPDIIETNYIDDPHLFDEHVVREDGIPSGISPAHLDHARDRLFQSTGRQSLTAIDLESEGQLSASSLGVVVTDIDGEVGNEIFIANDVWPNRFWVRDQVTSTWTEIASVSGLALDSTGTATAGMGIASGDFDRNQLIDFHVTNFYQQPSSLYLQTMKNLFADLAPKFGMVAPTYPMLGFGTQAIDADRDGYLDLIALNGHIEDFSVSGHGFRMRPQYFSGDGHQMELKPVDDPSGYWENASLGRALAKLDWNRDGRVDLVAGHLDLPLALLENRTETSGHWIQFELIGTSSERDAIGARVTVIANGIELTEWRTAGDGYLCNNEPFIDIGLGEARSIDNITIRWPTGTSQTVRGLSFDRRYLIVENDDEPTDMTIGANSL